MHRPVRHSSPAAAGRTPHAVTARRGVRTGDEKLAIALEVVVGGMAIAAGALFLVRPDGSGLGMTTSDLVRGPFADFRLPGAILLGVVGGSSLAAAWLVVRRHGAAAPALLASGAILVGFEAVQAALVTFSPLQPTIALCGAALGLLGLRLSGRTAG